MELLIMFIRYMIRVERIDCSTFGHSTLCLKPARVLKDGDVSTLIQETGLHKDPRSLLRKTVAKFFQGMLSSIFHCQNIWRCQTV
jgi:hypothetical protein